MTLTKASCALAAVLAAAIPGPALADTAETKGGITVRSEDGSFEAKLGGRIHFDAYLFGDETLNGVDGANNESGTEFRRTRLTLTGKAYGWEYKFEEDFAGTAVDEKDMHIATMIGPGKLTIGQFKPYRSMEELTSSNDVTMMERPFSSASGIFGGRQFQQGLGYLVGGEQYTFGASLFSLRNDATLRNEGVGTALRATYAPVVDQGSVIHLGASYSQEEFRSTLPGGQTVAAGYAGRRGDSETLGTIVASEGVSSIGLEAAATFGPAFIQAEYALMTLGQVAQDQDITSYYLVASYHLTGESRPYKKGTGVFGSAKPAASNGAWELTARYDFAKNSDAATEPEATALTLGTNYYVNPSMRFMLNYTMGETATVGAEDEADQLALRAQFSF